LPSSSLASRSSAATAVCEPLRGSTPILTVISSFVIGELKTEVGMCPCYKSHRCGATVPYGRRPGRGADSVRPLGCEPRTGGLRVRCSAVELEARSRETIPRGGVTEGTRTPDLQGHNLAL